MNELSIYGKDGLFHNVAKASDILNGRYSVLQKGAHDLNMNNLLSGLDLPTSLYPGVFCLPPVSDLPTGKEGWETFSFRLLFLTKTNSTGDNKIKNRDPNTNTSLHTIAQDWNDMKEIAWAYYITLTDLFPITKGFFRMGQRGTVKAIRVSGMQNDNVSGVMLMFNADVVLACSNTGFDPSKIIMPVDNHPKHFH